MEYDHIDEEVDADHGASHRLAICDCNIKLAEPTITPAAGTRPTTTTTRTTKTTATNEASVASELYAILNNRLLTIHPFQMWPVANLAIHAKTHHHCHASIPWKT